jgi:hypothetical protein
MISLSAPIPFSLTFYKSTGAVSSSESTHHLWKFFRWLFLSQQGLHSLIFSKSTEARHTDKSTRHLRKLFRWWFPSRHRHSFRSLFLSQQGLRALMNPRVTFGSGFIDDFWVDSGLVFFYYFWIKRGYVPLQIQASLVEDVSLKISKSAPTLFLLTISESTGAVRASESTCHLWKLFRSWFLSLQQLGFRWLFFSQERLGALTNSHVTFGTVSVMILELIVVQFSLTVSKSTGARHATKSTRHLLKFFHWLFLSQQGLRALPNPRVTIGRCFGDDFRVGSDAVFVDYFCVNRGYGSSRIHASHLESVSLMISQSALT